MWKHNESLHIIRNADGACVNQALVTFSVLRGVSIIFYWIIKKKKIFSFIETKLFIYILDGSLWISAYLLNREASPRVYVYLCMCVRGCTSVCVCVVYVYLSPLIAPLSLTGPGKRVCSCVSCTSGLTLFLATSNVGPRRHAPSTSFTTWPTRAPSTSTASPVIPRCTR